MIGDSNATVDNSDEGEGMEENSTDEDSFFFYPINISAGVFSAPFKSRTHR